MPSSAAIFPTPVPSLPIPSRILVTGPSRSGKSEWAETLAMTTEQPVIYVATAQENPRDQEWQARLAAHRRRRPPHWRTLEETLALGEALAGGQPGECWLVDSLGTWVANGLEQREAQWQTSQGQLLHGLTQTPSTVILVAEETGWGVVPAYALGRLFRDRLGHLTRQVGAIADGVYLVVAGYAMDVKALGTPVPSWADLPVAALEAEPDPPAAAL